MIHDYRSQHGSSFLFEMAYSRVMEVDRGVAVVIHLRTCHHIVTIRDGRLGKCHARVIADVYPGLAYKKKKYIVGASAV